MFAEALDSVLMPGNTLCNRSSLEAAPDVFIHHHRQKIKGERSNAGALIGLYSTIAETSLSTENGRPARAWRGFRQGTGSIVQRVSRLRSQGKGYLPQAIFRRQLRSRLRAAHLLP